MSLSMKVSQGSRRVNVSVVTANISNNQTKTYKC